MPEPLEFQSLQNLQTALRAISVAGGYHHDVASLAVKLDANHDVESLIGAAPLRPFIVIEVLSDTFVYDEKSRQTRVLLPAIVHFIDDSDPKVDDSLLKKFYRSCADIEQAIAVDTTRGGLATDTRVLKREMSELGGQVWSMVTIEIRVRRTHGEPNG